MRNWLNIRSTLIVSGQQTGRTNCGIHTFHVAASDYDLSNAMGAKYV